jgi:hypothetical protein
MFIRLHLASLYWHTMKTGGLFTPPHGLTSIHTPRFMMNLSVWMLVLLALLLMLLVQCWDVTLSQHLDNLTFVCWRWSVDLWKSKEQMPDICIDGRHQLWTATCFGKHLYLSLLVLLDFTAQEVSHAGKTDWQTSHNSGILGQNTVRPRPTRSKKNASPKMHSEGFNFAEERLPLLAHPPMKK